MDALNASEVRLTLTVATLGAFACWGAAALGWNTMAFLLGIIAVMNGALTALKIERHNAEAHARLQDDRGRSYPRRTRTDGDH